ncbi:MAG: hypothetical protein KDA45_09125 [Planctomycetales bacterium]|nr:hypothetical protein [Planctomycetales bacterium]
MILSKFAEQLHAFSAHPHLQSRLCVVLTALPEVVQRDFMDDHSFRITLEDFTPGQGWKLFMACPTPTAMMTRCVVLRRKLNDTSLQFTDYVIAHELAHAYLRNGGWGEITDIELAADALAASWGFERPASWRKS